MKKVFSFLIRYTLLTVMAFVTAMFIVSGFVPPSPSNKVFGGPCEPFWTHVGPQGSNHGPDFNKAFGRDGLPVLQKIMQGLGSNNPSVKIFQVWTSTDGKTIYTALRVIVDGSGKFVDILWLSHPDGSYPGSAYPKNIESIRNQMLKNKARIVTDGKWNADLQNRARTLGNCKNAPVPVQIEVPVKSQESVSVMKKIEAYPNIGFIALMSMGFALVGNYAISLIGKRVFA